MRCAGLVRSGVTDWCLFKLARDFFHMLAILHSSGGGIGFFCCILAKNHFIRILVYLLSGRDLISGTIDRDLI